MILLKKQAKLYGILAIALSAIILWGCNKNNFYDTIIPPSLPEFLTASSSDNLILDQVSDYNIPIGLIASSNASTDVHVHIASPSGAVAGQEYNVTDTVITIPAGKVLDSSLVITPIASKYIGTNRVDTLVITLSTSVSDGIATPLESSKTQFTLYIRETCPLDIDNILGAAVIDDPNFWDATSKATITKIDENTLHVVGIFDQPTWGFDMVINLETKVVTVARQAVGPAGSILPGSSYTNPTVAGTGTYDSCNDLVTLSLNYRVAQGEFGTYSLTIHK